MTRAGTPPHEAVFGNVRYDDSPGGYYGSVSNLHAAQDRSARADPCANADMNWLPSECAGSFARYRDCVRVTDYADVRADPDAATDGDIPSNVATLVDEYIIFECYRALDLCHAIHSHVRSDLYQAVGVLELDCRVYQTPRPDYYVIAAMEALGPDR